MIQDFVSDDLNHLKGLRGCYRIHEHIAMDTDEVLRVEDAVFILKVASDSTYNFRRRQNVILPGQLYQ